MIKGLKNDTHNKMLGNFYYLAWRGKNGWGTLELLFKYVYVSVPRNGDQLVSVSIEDVRVQSSGGWVRTGVLSVQSWHPQRQHHLEVCEKCTCAGPVCHLLIQKLLGGGSNLCFNKPPHVILMHTEVGGPLDEI